MLTGRTARLRRVLVSESQALTPRGGKIVSPLTTDLGFPASNGMENKNRKATPAVRTVIAPAHGFKVETPWNERCYTSEEGLRYLGDSRRAG